MAYFIAYDTYGNLTMLSETILGIRENETVKECQGEYPNDSQYYWDKTLLEFVKKPAREITKLEYMNRFYDYELAAIYTLAKTTIQIEIWLERFKFATVIDLNDLQIIQGMLSLEDHNIIALGRAAEILTQ
jgi:hypothetical protein